MIKDPLFNLPTCDICQELNKEDRLMMVFDIDTHEDLMVCDTCLKMNADQLREPGDIIDHVYESMREER